MVPRQSDNMNAPMTTRPSPKAQGPWSPSQPRAKPSTTPAGMPPPRTPGHTNRRRPDAPSKGLSTPGRAPLPASSPNYFDFMSEPDSNPPNSNAGIHAKRNWSPPSGPDNPSNPASPANYPLEHQPRFEIFRRESDTNVFKLSHGSIGKFGSSSQSSPSTLSPTANVGGPSRSATQQSASSPRTEDRRGDAMDVDRIPDSLDQVPRQRLDSRTFFGDERRDSPANDSNLDLSNLQRSQLSHIDERHPRFSLPHNRVDSAHADFVQRAETLPTSLHTDGPTMMMPDEASRIIKLYLPDDILLLDLRVYPQYSKSRIVRALNLCIPTTLLKRASFNIKKLSETFTKPNERAKFDHWRDAKVIIVYDGSSGQLSDAASCVNILKKFAIEDFKGATYVLRGGFAAFSKKFSEQIDKRPPEEMDGSNMKGLSINPPASAPIPIAGGCAMPPSQTAANPFFGTIRQNMDLIDGVGQIPITLPAAFKGKPNDALPDWLRKAANVDDKGRMVSNTFLDIEKAEEHRMKKALSVNVSHNTPHPLPQKNFQVAGIEKGLKNRYKDILPYDHTRVKLQGVPSGDCDYVNASHVQAYGSSKCYIASQAPVPATFQDFWRVVWEQDARVIVMLTAETEGGNRKSHPYWLPDTYGSFKIKNLSERKVSIDRKDAQKPPRSFTTPLKPSPNESASSRPQISRRHSSKHSISSPSSSSPKTPSSLGSPIDPDHPHVIIRKVALTNTHAPFEPLREITQLHYSAWPDFGAPAHPAHVLGLVERCSDVVRSYEHQSTKPQKDSSAEEIDRPVVVHCSAGCGRTGTFCTIDSVIDMLKRQRAHRRRYPDHPNPPLPSPGDVGVHDAMDVDPPSSSQQLQQQPSSSSSQALDDPGQDTEAWLHSDEIDLVARAVAGFREQRLSMVQTLGQFVLCYESVLEWVVGEVEKGGGGGVW